MRTRLSSLATATVMTMAMLFASSGAMAQIVTANGGIAPLSAIAFGPVGSNATAVTPATPLPVGGKQENVTLVTANVAAVAQGVYGGDYLLGQTCSAYGTLALQVLGPDGTTFQTILSKTASDSAGGTGIALGSNAVVKATVSGTTGCVATLSRVP